MRTTAFHTPSDHVDFSRNIQGLLTGMIDHIRYNTEIVDETGFKALLEASADVLVDLRMSFERYDQRHDALSLMSESERP